MELEKISRIPCIKSVGISSLGGDSRNLLLSVGQVCGDRELSLSTDGHTVQSLVPSLDDFPSAENEGEWCTGSVGVKLLAVGQFTNVSRISVSSPVLGRVNLPHRQSLAGLGDGTGTGLDVLVLESRSESPLHC